MNKISQALFRSALFPRKSYLSQLKRPSFGPFRLLNYFSTYPNHELLTMPALSPTMTQGKIVKWYKKEGDKLEAGDVICDIETDKATMGFEVQEKGYLAKTLNSQEFIPLGTPLAVVIKKADLLKQFASYSFSAKQAEPQVKATTPPAQNATAAKAVQPPPETPSAPITNVTTKSQERILASPLAKSLASQKGIDLAALQGSGPGGRIIKQDVQGYVVPEKPTVQATFTPTQTVEAKQPQKLSKTAFSPPTNPFEQVSLTSMRKTIANRLSESKKTIPHYYVSSSIEMDAINALRNELNKNQKQNGVKISINDIIIRATALALRDFPNVNVQWHGQSIRKFKHADISIAVAIEGGLITPIVFRAETLGFIDIAKRTKDIVKRAREGKLDPNEFVGGTSTISNLGMFGVDSVSSIINLPQATILGVGKTEKKLLVDEKASDPTRPYRQGVQIFRVAQVMEVIASVDHRAVDGALAAQWLMRIKKYLENPTHMLL